MYYGRDKGGVSTEVTYARLKAMRDGGMLVPGTQYRITDYVTTTVQGNTQSAGHVFDIIVTADDESTLNENARAIQHDGDTYFADSNLAGWRLKYSLDNDTSKFAWADATNGKGVIYWLQDESGNECAYDFKNILFKGTGGAGTLKTKYYFTFSVATGTDDANITDHSLHDYYCYENKMAGYWASNKQKLNQNIFRNTTSNSSCMSNVFGVNCNNNVFGTNCYSNEFGSSCYNNVFGTNCYSNEFGVNCYNNVFGSSCDNNVFVSSCMSNVFGSSCDNNVFDTNCRNNTFEQNCIQNRLGSRTSYVHAGNYVQYCGFGDDPVGSGARISHIQRVTIDSGVTYATIHGGTSDSDIVKNVHLLPGYYGGTVTFDTNKDYTQMAGVDSSGAIKVWNLADNV